MPIGQVADAIRTFSRPPDARADGELLARFVADRDEAAFAELIRRHGPTVYGVCRRALGHADDADDAFQAVFLVLARRARDVRPGGAVGNFLYGVAVRTAAKARAAAVKRRRRLMSAAKPEPVAYPIEPSDLGPVLDEELARLPDKYRAAVVLCDLNGKSRSEAAAELGWPEGTVAARVAKAREMLATRLRARGVSLPAAGLTAALAQQAAAAVPAALSADALASALAFAAPTAAFTAAVPAPVHLLAEEIMRGLSIGKWKLPAVLLLVSGMMIGGVGVMYTAGSGPADTAGGAPKAANTADQSDVPVGNVALKDHGTLVDAVAWAPDGKTFASISVNGTVIVRDAGTFKTRVKMEATGESRFELAFTQGGKSLAVVGSGPDGAGGLVTFYDPATGAQQKKVAWNPNERFGGLVGPDGFKLDSKLRIGLSSDGTRLAAPSDRQNAIDILTVPNLQLAAACEAAEGGRSLVHAPPVFSPDGKRLAFVESSVDIARDPVTITSIRICDATNGKAVATLQEERTDHFWALAFSPDGTHFAAAGHQRGGRGRVTVWDIPAGKVVFGFTPKYGTADAVAYSPDGKTVACGFATRRARWLSTWGVNETRLFDAATGKLLKTLECETDARITGLAFSPDGKSLLSSNGGLYDTNGQRVTDPAAVAKNGAVRLWRLTPDEPAVRPGGKEKEVLKDHDGLVYSVAFAPDGKTFASIGADETVIVWDAVTLAKRKTFSAGITAPVGNGVAPSPGIPGSEQLQLVYTTDGMLAVFRSGIDFGPEFVYFNPSTGDRLDARRGGGRGPKVMALSPDGSRIAVRTDNNTIRVDSRVGGKDVEVEKSERTRDVSGMPTAVTFSPDGTRVALIEGTNVLPIRFTIRLCDTTTGKTIATLDDDHHHLYAIAFSPDGKKIAAAGGSDVGRVVVWDATTFQVVSRIPTPSAATYSVAFSPDGNTIAAGVMRAEKNWFVSRHVNNVQLFDVASGKLRRVLATNPDEGVASLAFSPNGDTLIHASGNYFHRITTGRLADPRARAKNGEVGVWRLTQNSGPEKAAAKPAKEMPPEWTERPAIELPGWLAGSAAYAPDGKLLVVGGSDGHVRACDAATLKMVWEYGSDAPFAAVAFSTDGKTVGVAVKDGAQFLDTATGKPTNTLEEKGSAPTAIGFFADEATGRDGPGPGSMVHQVILGTGSGYSVKTWLTGGPPSTMRLDVTRPGKQPADPYAVPLAVGPAKVSKHVLVTGPLDRATGRNVFWAKRTGQGGNNELLGGHKATVTAAAWSTDGKTIVSGDVDGVVITWDEATFKEKSRLKLPGRVAAVAVTADGTRGAAAVASTPAEQSKPSYAEEVFVWDTARPPTVPKPLSTHPAGGTFTGTAGLTFSPDGKTLAAAFFNSNHLRNLGELVGKVRVWDVVEAKPAPEPAPAGNPVEQAWGEKTVLDEHNGPVSSVMYNADRKTFASVGADGTVIGWDAETLAPAFRVKLGDADRPALASKSAGNTLFATTRKGYAMFDPAVGNVLGSNSFAGARAIAYAPTKKRLAISDGRRTVVTLVPAPDGGTISLNEPPGADKDPSFAGVAWSPDGERLAVNRNEQVGGKWAVGVWGGGKDQPMTLLAGHGNRVSAVVWATEGDTIATADEGGEVVLWDGKTLKEIRRVRPGEKSEIDASVRCVAFSPDGKTVAAGVTFAPSRAVGKRVTRHGVWIWDVATGKQVARFGESVGPPCVSLAFSADGKTLAVARGGRDSGGPVGVETGSLIVYERAPAPPVAPATNAPALPQAWRAEPPVALETKFTFAATFAPDGKTFAVDELQKSVVYGTVDLKTRYTVEGGSPRFAGAELLTWNGAIASYANAGTTKKILSVPETKGAVLSHPVFSRDGKRIAGLNLIRARQFDVATGSEPVRLAGQQDGFGDGKSGSPGAGFDWSPDGTRLAGFFPFGEPGQAGGLGVWDAESGKQLAVKRTPANDPAGTAYYVRAAFTPDGKHLAVGETSSARRTAVALLDAGTLKQVWSTPVAEKFGVVDFYALAVSPDGTTIAAGLYSIFNRQGRVVLFDAASGREVGALSVPADAWCVSALAFAPDGTTLVAVTGAHPSVTAGDGDQGKAYLCVWRAAPKE